jgi:hypothetical protein
MLPTAYLSPQHPSFGRHILDNGVRDNKVQLGFGETANLLKGIFKSAYQHYSVPVTRISTRDKFRILTATWQQDTQFMSFTADIVSHPAYQRVIGMGQEALPLIFEQLRYNPDHWFSALEAITGVNPVTKEHRGNVSAAAQDWLAWGRTNEFLR